MENKEILDGIKSVSDKVDASKAEQLKSIGEIKNTAETKYAEAEKLIADIDKKFDDQVKQLNEDLAKKGASLKEISDAIDNLKKKQGKLSAAGGPEVKHAADVIAQLMADNEVAIKNLKKGERLDFDTELKAGNITISNVSGSGPAVNANYSYYNTFFTRPTRKVNIRDLVPVINSATGTFVYYRQPIPPVGGGSFAFQAGQGNAKATLDYNLTQIIIACDYLAGTVRIAKQMLQDLPAMQTFVSTQLLEDYRRAESASFVPTLVGSAQPFTPNPTTTVTVEKIVQSIGDLLGKDWNPNGIISDSLTWAKIINTKPSNYSIPGGGSAITIDGDGVIRFLGMPLMVQNNMSRGNIIVGDFSQAAIIQADGLSIGFFEQDQDNVVKNLITARVEARVAFTVMNPQAFDQFGAGTT